MSIIKGTAFWASVQQPNTKFEPVWSIDVCNLDDAAKATLKNDGLEDKIKNKEDERGDFIQLKQKVHARDGSMFVQPKVIDSSKNEFTDLIGNGSTVAAKYATRDYDFAGNVGVTADLKAVQVIKLVPYEGKAPEEEEDDFESYEPSDVEDLPVATA